MNIVSFTDYDLFAYLMVGLAAFAVWGFLAGPRVSLREHTSVGAVALIITFAYVLGQMIHAPSGLVFERWVTAGWLKRPSNHLLAPHCNSHLAASPTPWFRHADPSGYYEALPCATQRKIEKRKAELAISQEVTSEGLFAEAWPFAMRDPVANPRLTIFSKLYTFNRNMAFVFFVGAILAAVMGLRCAHRWRRQHIPCTPGEHQWKQLPGWLQNHWSQSFVLLFVAFMLFLQFLYFYRLYSVEVFTAFANPNIQH